MIVTNARIEDLDRVAEIFLAGFFGSVEFLFEKEKPNLLAAKDVLEVFWRFEPNCIWVAREDDDVIGYIIATKSIREIWIKTVFSGIWFKWVLKWLIRKYGFRAKPIYKILKNKLLFIKDEKASTKDKDCGRILSIAIDHKNQGKGISKNLIRAGIDYLRNQGLKYVKLEVRPDNIAAYQSYIAFGFQVVGKMEDMQGPWVIMLKKL